MTRNRVMGWLALLLGSLLLCPGAAWACLCDPSGNPDDHKVLYLAVHIDELSCDGTIGGECTCPWDRNRDGVLNKRDLTPQSTIFDVQELKQAIIDNGRRCKGTLTDFRVKVRGYEMSGDAADSCQIGLNLPAAQNWDVTFARILNRDKKARVSGTGFSEVANPYGQQFEVFESAYGGADGGDRTTMVFRGEFPLGTAPASHWSFRDQLKILNPLHVYQEGTCGGAFSAFAAGDPVFGELLEAEQDIEIPLLPPGGGVVFGGLLFAAAAWVVRRGKLGAR